MIVALAESVLGTDFGLNISLDNVKDIDTKPKLFAESHSRFICSIKPENKDAFEILFKEKALLLGEVNNSGNFIVDDKGQNIINEKVNKLMNAWRTTF